MPVVGMSGLDGRSARRDAVGSGRKETNPKGGSGHKKKNKIQQSAEACRAIEADLGAISPSRAAAGGGHGRLAEGERAFCTFMYHILTQRAAGTRHARVY